MKTFKQYHAKMKTLYVCRYVTNGEEIIKWAKKAGLHLLTDLVPVNDLHCTIAFSRKEVDWNKMSFDKKGTTVHAGGYREVAPLGDKGAIVLKFTSDDLEDEWAEFKGKGCSWDYSGFQPHITIAYKGVEMDHKKIPPFKGDIVLGPQVKNVVDDNWVSKLKKAD